MAADGSDGVTLRRGQSAARPDGAGGRIVPGTGRPRRSRIGATTVRSRCRFACWLRLSNSAASSSACRPRPSARAISLARWSVSPSPSARRSSASRNQFVASSVSPASSAASARSSRAVVSPGRTAICSWAWRATASWSPVARAMSRPRFWTERMSGSESISPAAIRWASSVRPAVSSATASLTQPVAEGRSSARRWRMATASSLRPAAIRSAARSSCARMVGPLYCSMVSSQAAASASASRARR